MMSSVKNKVKKSAKEKKSSKRKVRDEEDELLGSDNDGDTTEEGKNENCTV
jgi:hypothetical protein